MGILQPTPPPYDPIAWLQRPFAERGRVVCQAWAVQGFGTPIGAYALYVVKAAFYVWAWTLFCARSPELGGLSTIAHWWLSPLAFEKAILWSMMFEGLGLGCGSGPLTGRYFPPLGGFLYFLRPGTTKLPIFRSLPILGGSRRTWFDVLVYAAVIAALVRALTAPAVGNEQLIPIAILVVIAGLADRTLFLCMRGEHYWTTVICFIFAGDWIAGAKSVQIALWFFAGFSKLNHHFPMVVGVMTSNSPATRFAWFRRRMYRDFPLDLRPSGLATYMGHAGTFLELTVPIILMLSPGGPSLWVGLVMMLMLHGFITSNVPMGVPIEWNMMVVYGAFALFWAHPDVTVLDLGSIPLAVFLAVMLLAVPILGNIHPGAISFLMAMRYYAGNWAYSVWMFRGDTHKKLEKLTTSAAWVHTQLGYFYDRPTSVGIVSKLMAFRLMHLHGRALPLLVPKAVTDLTEYEYLDGEVVAGMVLGWNFGDGHLHDEKLLRAVQEQCGFESGELRCIFVESQPLGQETLNYRIHDAKTGLMLSGDLEVSELRGRQPWAAV
jgi:Transmembrane protein of unknown function (DUF3556)